MSEGPLQQRARGIFADPMFREGSREMLTTSLGIGAWGLVTGVAMVKSGMSLPLALLMGWTVYAGSAQLAVVPLMAAGAPLWVVWFTAICVNLRFVILSTMWRGYFGHLRLRHRLAIGYFSGDVIFVNFMRRYPDAKPQAEQVPYYWGAAITNWLAWQIPSTLGIFLAHQIPLSWGLGFAGVLALLGVLLSMLRDRPSWAACIVASMAAVAAFALPLKLNILVAIAAAVAAGVTMEQLQQQLRRLPEPLGDGGGEPSIRPPDASRGERHARLPLPETEAAEAAERARRGKEPA